MTDDILKDAETDKSEQEVTDSSKNNDQDTSNEDVFADKLSSITNEDGTPKYTDVVSALDSIPYAQKHISTLEKELQEQRDALAQEKAAKELLAKQLGKTDEKPAQQGLTEEQIAEIALKAQREAQASQTAQDNVDSVNRKFSEVYGDKAVDEMRTVARESGMTIAQIRELAKSSPQAVYRLAGINQSHQGQPPKSPGSGSGDNFTPPKTPEEPKSIMSGASTKDLVDNWKAAGEKVAARNQQQ